MQPVILKKTESYVAIHKPAEWLTIPGRGNKEGIPILSHWLGKELNQKIFIVHRLDQGTSGIVLFALNANAHREFSMMFEKGEIKKTYLAIVKGNAKNQIIDAPIFKLPTTKKNKSVINAEKGKPAQTIIKSLKEKNGISLVEAVPLTGRTHQIRVHLSSIGCPLLGDPLYGGPKEWGGENLPHPLLHAQKLEFLFPASVKNQIHCEPTGLFQDFLFKIFD